MRRPFEDAQHGDRRAQPTEDGRLDTSVGGWMHLHALDEGREHPRLADVLGRDREQVAIENDEIGGLPDLERSGVPLAMVQRGPLDRIGPEQRIKRNTLRWVPDR